MPDKLISRVGARALSHNPYFHIRSETPPMEASVWKESESDGANG